jgi:hypothetical protein
LKYKDRELDEGPCKTVLIRDGRRLKAICSGRGPTTDFAYDLVPGIDEGVVNVVLTLGAVRYCTAFDDFNGRDGSDGKKFQARDSMRPRSCPGLPSPSGAFIELSNEALE